MKFTELGLKEEILSSLKKMGYEDLTPIQEATYHHIVQGRDILGLAETGSGKTSACGIPLAQLVEPRQGDVQALVLVPTRELAQQYVTEIDNVCEGMKVSCFAVFGGFPLEIQLGKLNDGVDILVATPGRLIDLIYSNVISLTNVKTLVLDEADEMLNMGFIDDVRFIMSCVVNTHQTLFFSATMPKEVVGLANECLNDPIRVELTQDRKAPVNLSHHFKNIHFRDKLRDIADYLEKEEITQAIIFCNSRNSVEELYRELKRSV